MTDKERLIALLNSFNIEYIEETRGSISYIILAVGNTNVTGYSGFRSSFDFNMNGNFIEVDIYE